MASLIINGHLPFLTEAPMKVELAEKATPVTSPYARLLQLPAATRRCFKKSRYVAETETKDFDTPPMKKHNSVLCGEQVIGITTTTYA